MENIEVTRTLHGYDYLVLVDGVADRADTPYRGNRGGLQVALNDAHAIKAAHPTSCVTVEVLFES